MPTLYHGTSSRFRANIMRSGIRRFNWFSTDIEDAKDFGEQSVFQKGGSVDIWKVDVPPRELDRISWRLGSKRGVFYKLHHKPSEKPDLLATYPWDSSMVQRAGKVI